MKVIHIASSNQGKLREYRELAEGSGITLELLPNFAQFAEFQESAPTFAENSAGKAIHYSQFSDHIVLAEDSGLVVPALGGAPGVHSARYAGANATDQDRVRKLLAELHGKQSQDRRAYFVCVITLARTGRPLAVISDRVDGVIAEESRGAAGFGYDPVFFLPETNRTFAELTQQEKNLYSHRGKAFRKTLPILQKII